MNKKFVLTLVSSPALFASMLSMVMMTQPAHANQTVNSTQSNSSCVSNSHATTRPLTCVRVNKANASSKVIEFTAPQAQKKETAEELKFTDEESDAAIALYGCDCVACINAVRGMRNLPPIS
jgi:hypothetical protein